MGSLFARFGCTRDDAKWGRLQALSLAALVSSGTLNLQYWAHYLGIPLSATAQHWIIVIASITLWIAGKNDTSDLRGRNDPPVATVGGGASRYVPVVLLAAALALGGCALLANARHRATVTVVTAHAVLSAVQDAEGALVCGRPSAPEPPACVPLAAHQQVAAQLAIAFDYDMKANRVARALPPGDPSPDVATLLGQIGAVVDRVLALIPPSPQRQALLAKIGVAR